MADLAAIVSRLEAVAARLEGAAPAAGGGAAPPAATAAGGGGGGGGGGASVDGYDEIISGSLQQWIDLSAKVGGDVAAQANLVKAAFDAQREFVVLASKAKQPAQSDLPSLLQATSTAIGEIQSFREAQRRSKQFNHLSMVSEGIPALGWVTVAPKPCPFIKEMKDAGTFYTNRVIKEFKGNDDQQVAWARGYTQVLTDLHDYVKRVHTTGLVWNKNGGDAKSLAGSSSSAAATKSAAAPAKAAAAPVKAAAAAAPGSDAKSGLFAALNKGGGVTAGLKKVDRSQMTHKNPELRASSVVAAAPVKKAAAPAKKTFGAAVKKDPVFALNGKKWQVEFQSGNRELVIDDANMKQTVYVYKCDNSTLQVKGKVNSITIDGCKKFAIVFETAVATLDLVNCQSVQVQVLNKVPTVSIDKTDGAQVYLSAESLDTQIVSAKSSEMNVLVPGDDGDFKEVALPEQYQSVLKDGEWVTSPTDIAG